MPWEGTPRIFAQASRTGNSSLTFTITPAHPGPTPLSSRAQGAQITAPRHAGCVRGERRTRRTPHAHLTSSAVHPSGHSLPGAGKLLSLEEASDPRTCAPAHIQSGPLSRTFSCSWGSALSSHPKRRFGAGRPPNHLPNTRDGPPRVSGTVWPPPPRSLKNDLKNPRGTSLLGASQNTLLVGLEGRKEGPRTSPWG